MFKIIESHSHTRVTCVTCKLKKCVGRCHFENVPRKTPRPRKAA